ncbi:MAG: nucleoside 2-deoxyribosyltransferase domain-containing protein [Saprospiraceae bacterium]|nr:nucleoside 2-deoxyribosyltransferase domain-containing protein [Saprospiraceae bacterium]
MATIIKPPESLGANLAKPGLFLEGTIEMGGAEEWQSYVGNKMKSFDIVILNPRKVSWDSS